MPEKGYVLLFCYLAWFGGDKGFVPESACVWVAEYAYMSVA